MRDDLEPIVHDAVMKILSAIYESGLVEKVDLSVVYELFGVKEDADDTVVDFSDPSWIEDYMRYKGGINDDAEMHVINIDGSELNDEVKAQLRDMGLPEEAIEAIEDDIENYTAEDFDDGLSDSTTLSGRGPRSDESIH